MPGQRSASPADPDEVVLTDARAVRALAHPARLVVIDALYAGQVLTATECADLAGVSPSAMSYHLRALERFGIVRRAQGRGDARERPWEQAAPGLRVALDRSSGATGAVAAAELLITESMQLDRQRLLAAMAHRSGNGPDERTEVAGYSRTMVVVTADEARALVQQVHELLEPFEAERRTPPEGAERVTFSLTVVPDDPVASGSQG